MSETLAMTLDLNEVSSEMGATCCTIARRFFANGTPSQVWVLRAAGYDEELAKDWEQTVGETVIKWKKVRSNFLTSQA